MITLDRLLKTVYLTEGIQFYQYKAIIKITYNPDEKLHMGAEKLAEMLRAVPGVTRVSTASLNKDDNTAIFNVKVVSQKSSPKGCFLALKRTSVSRFKGAILKVEIGVGTIERKNFIR